MCRKDISKKLKFSNPYFFASPCHRPLIFQTMSYVGSKSPSLKYYRVAPLGCEDIGGGKFKFVAKTRFISNFSCL